MILGDNQMDNKGMDYTFSANIWYSEWYYISLPKAMAEEIKLNHKFLEAGWKRLNVISKIGNSQWKTAFDTKQQTYFLPIKAEIRKKTHLGR